MCETLSKKILKSLLAVILLVGDLSTFPLLNGPNICEDTTLASQQASHWRNAIYHYLNIRADLSVFANLLAASADVYQYNNSRDPEKVQT